MIKRIAFIAALILASGLLLVGGSLLPSHNLGGIAGSKVQRTVSLETVGQPKIITGEDGKKRNPNDVRYIKLDNPDEMLKLKKNNPDLYARVHAIIRAGRTVSSDSFPSWVKIHHHADNGQASDILYTSWPSQRRMSFTLDGTSFSGLVRESTVFAYGMRPPSAPKEREF